MKAALAVSALALAFASTTAQAADVPSADKTFMKKAAEGGLLEIQASQIAVQKTQDSQVKSFADKMVTDHTKAGDELNALAQSKGVTLADRSFHYAARQAEDLEFRDRHPL